MELNARETMLLKQLTQLLNLGMSVSAATDQLRVMISDDQLVDRVLAEREEIIASQWRLSVDSTLFDPEDIPGPWYQGPVDTDKFWPKLRQTLLNDPGWANAVPGLDEASTRIVTLLADPHSPVIATRGLVLGYVQSGKTANFTATIAKAADSGYRMFIVLSGVHNSLRRQTQLRMDEQLCDLNPTEWIQLTDEFRDFGNPVKALPLVAGTEPGCWLSSRRTCRDSADSVSGSSQPTNVAAWTIAPFSSSMMRPTKRVPIVTKTPIWIGLESTKSS